MLNLVFVGYRHGHTGAIYAEAMADPNVNVLGAWEPTEEGRKMAAATGMEFNYATLEDVLADERVDAISLGGVYGERGGHAIAALKAGKHVYADKPICTRLEELDEIEKLAKEKNLKVGCYLTMRFSKGMKTLRDMISAGELGEIGAVNLTGQHPLMYGSRPMWYFEEGQHGGTINDIAIHGLDLVRFLTGLELKNITGARCWNHWSTEVKTMNDCGQFMVEMSNGCGFTADVSYAAPASCGYALETYWRVTIWGTKGVAEYKLKGGTKQVGTDSSDDALLQIALEGSDGFKPYEKVGYDVTGVGEFVKEINGETDLLIDTADVLRTTRDILRIQAAADAK